MSVRLAVGGDRGRGDEPTAEGGFAVRLGDELLFVERRADETAELIAAFVAGGDGHRVDAVTELLDEREVVPPLVMVSWRDRIRVVVGGEAEISSTATKLDALSRPGADRWAERSLPAGSPVSLSAGDATGEPDPDSDLIAGAVPAGTVRLSLNDRSSIAPAGRLDGPAADWPPPAPAPPAATPAAQQGAPPDGIRPPEPEPPQPPAPAPAAEPAAPATVTGTLSWDGAYEDPLDDPNNPTVIPSPRQAFRPTGRIRFDDGSVEPLDQPLVIGRNPTSTELPDGTRPVAWEKPSVSRAHVEVRPNGMGAEVIDLGSRNGTFVLNLAATDLHQLEPRVPKLIEPGMQVLIGEHHFVFELVTA